MEIKEILENLKYVESSLDHGSELHTAMTEAVKLLNVYASAKTVTIYSEGLATHDWFYILQEAEAIPKDVEMDEFGNISGTTEENEEIVARMMQAKEIYLTVTGWVIDGNWNL